jgi:glycosyltransferase involved in cell wall biosynthesis
MIKHGLVSAILPVKNSASTLEETIRSVQLQVYENWELVIVVAPSADVSLELSKRFSNFDNRIKVIHDNTSKGIAEACNLALAECTGEFVAICNADDINMPNRFLAQQNYLRQNPEVGVLGSNVQTFGKQYNYWNLPTDHNQIAPTMLFRGSIANPTAMIRRQVLLDHGLEYDVRFNRGSEDLDLWERLSCVTELRNLNYALIRYRISDTQLSAVTALTSLENARKVRERILLRLGISDLGIHKEIQDSIADNKNDISIEEVSDWFERIKNANHISKHFDQAALARVIEKEKFMIIERNLQNRKSRYVNSSSFFIGLSSKLPLSWKIRAVEILKRSD